MRLLYYFSDMCNINSKIINIRLVIWEFRKCIIFLLKKKCSRLQQSAAKDICKMIIKCENYNVFYIKFLRKLANSQKNPIIFIFSISPMTTFFVLIQAPAFQYIK